MRKFILFSFLILFILNLHSERAYLLPSRDGKPSEIVPVESTGKVKSKDIRKDLLKHYEEEKNARGVFYWMLNTDNGTANYVLTGIADVDTFLNWFAPPAACTVLAYEVTNKANYGDPNQDEFTMFFATLDQGIDYATEFPEYHGNGAPSSNYGFATVVQSLDTFAWGLDTLWTITQDTLNPPIDVGRDKFACGWVKARGDSSPNPYIYANGSPPYHTLMYRDRGHGYGWYSSWHCVRMRALVNFYGPLPIHADCEDLPDSYNQGSRTVKIHAIHYSVSDSAGVEDIIIKYQLNSGSVNETSCILYSGDSTDGYWKGNIPGVFPGDTILYWSIATGYENIADTSPVFSYIIRQGDPGDFLYVDNDYTVSPILPDYYSDTIDVWDYSAYGPPDSSVICHYAYGSEFIGKSIVWRDWGCIALGDGENYGAGIYYSDSTWIKILLDNGGRFWLSDQDQGYGFGICPDWGQQGVPDGHWVREYLGIKGMYDDHPLLGGIPVTAYGNPADPVIGDMFAGIGLQAAGAVYIAPYYALTGNFNYAYTGSFDSLETGAVVNMFDVNGLTISYRYEGPGGSDYKVYNDFFPWDFIAKPTAPDTLDIAVIDSLVEDVLGWFSWDAVPEDRTLEPSKIVKLLPVGIVTNEAMIKFSLPGRMIISLDIYDNTGRLVKNIINGEVGAGLHTYRWNAKASGVYFYRLKTGDKTLTNKMVVIK